MRTTDLYGTVPGPRRVSPATRRAATGAHGTSARRSARHAGTPVPTGGDATTGPAAGWRGGHRRAAGRATRVTATVLVSLGWLLAILAAPHVSLSPGGRMLALFCYLTCLVMGFGAVLTVSGSACAGCCAANHSTLCSTRHAERTRSSGWAWPVSSSAAPRWDRTPPPRWYGSSCSRCSWSASTGWPSAGPHLPARLVDRDADRLPQRAQLMQQAESLPVLPGLNLTAALPLAVWPQRDDAPLGGASIGRDFSVLVSSLSRTKCHPCIEDGIGGCS